MKAYFFTNCAELPLSNICYLFRWSPYVTFFFLSPPNYDLPRKDPSSLFWLSEGTTQALGRWHSHPPSASCSSGLHGTSHAFSDLMSERQLLLLSSPLPCPGPTSVLTLMQAAPRMHWDAGTWKSGLGCQKTLALETYSYSPERKDSLSKPHLTATQFPFLFPDLNQCLFFSSSAAWYLVPAAVLIPPPPTRPAVPALHLLGTSDSTLLVELPEELFSIWLGPLRL